MIMIDPKMLELSVYEGILMPAEVVTVKEGQPFVGALEMDPTLSSYDHLQM